MTLDDFFHTRPLCESSPFSFHFLPLDFPCHSTDQLPSQPFGCNRNPPRNHSDLHPQEVEFLEPGCLGRQDESHFEEISLATFCHGI